MRLTLDWDTPADRDEHLDVVKRAAPGPWQLRRSSSGVGYHFIAWGVFNDTPGGVTAALRQRPMWGDDEQRTDLDRQRWELGSPFTNLLYRRKYVAVSDRPPYETGSSSYPVAGTLIRDDDERIKDDEGRLDYRAMLAVAVEQESVDELARRTGLKSYADDRGGRTAPAVRAYLTGSSSFENVPSSHPLKRVLRRFARSRGLGHFIADPTGGRSADADEGIDVDYLDTTVERRTIVEYLDVPWGEQTPEGEDRDYKLAQVETGSFNPNHTPGQLRMAHDLAVEEVIDRLSPTSPRNDVTLDLDRGIRREKPWAFEGPDPAVRGGHSIHYEQEVMDPGEPDVHLANLPATDRVEGEPGDHVVVEVLLWDQDLRDVEWHVLLVDDGDGFDDATVLKDTRGWF